MTRAAKIDANQPEIVEALRKVGAFVQSLAGVGKGCPDLLVGFRGVWYLLEIKDGKKSPSKRVYTPDQERWIFQQLGDRAHVSRVESVDQALAAIGAIP